MATTQANNVTASSDKHSRNQKLKVKKQKKEFLAVQREKNHHLRQLEKLKTRSKKMLRAQIGENLWNIPGNVNRTLSSTDDLMTTAKQVLDQLLSKVNEITKIFNVPEDFDLVGFFLNFYCFYSQIVAGNKIGIVLAGVALARQCKIDFSAWFSMFTSAAAGVETEEFEQRQNDSSHTRQWSVALNYGLDTNGYRYPDNLDMGTFLSGPSTAEELRLSAEMFDSVPDNLLQTIAAGLIAFSSLLCSGGRLDYSGVLKHLGEFGRAAVGFTKISDLIEWFKRTFMEIYVKWNTGYELKDLEFDDKYPDHEKVIGQIAMLLGSDFKKEYLELDEELCRAVLKLDEDLHEMIVESVRNKDTQLSQILKHHANKLKDTFVAARDSAASCHKVRAKPMTIYLYGGSGVGKSNLTTYLKFALYKRYFEKDPNWTPQNVCHLRCAENEFWDGILPNQPMVQYDDIFQKQDTISAPNPEVFEIIRACNEAPYHLHMSDIRDKKNSFFNAKFIIATSNVRQPAPNSIAKKEALQRRWELCINVKVNPQYAKHLGKELAIDEQKVAEAKRKTGKAFIPDIWHFSRYNMVSGVEKDEIMMLEDLEELIFRETDAAQVQSQSLVDDMCRVIGITVPRPSTDISSFTKQFKAQEGGKLNLDDMPRVETCFQMATFKERESPNFQRQLEEELFKKVQTEPDLVQFMNRVHHNGYATYRDRGVSGNQYELDLAWAHTFKEWTPVKKPVVLHAHNMATGQSWITCEECEFDLNRDHNCTVHLQKCYKLLTFQCKSPWVKVTNNIEEQHLTAQMRFMHQHVKGVVFIENARLCKVMEYPLPSALQCSAFSIYQRGSFIYLRSGHSLYRSEYSADTFLARRSCYEYDSTDKLFAQEASDSEMETASEGTEDKVPPRRQGQKRSKPDYRMTNLSRTFSQRMKTFTEIWAEDIASRKQTTEAEAELKKAKGSGIWKKVKEIASAAKKKLHSVGETLFSVASFLFKFLRSNFFNILLCYFIFTDFCPSFLIQCHRKKARELVELANCQCECKDCKMFSSPFSLGTEAYLYEVALFMTLRHGGSLLWAEALDMCKESYVVESFGIYKERSMRTLGMCDWEAESRETNTRFAPPARRAESREIRTRFAPPKRVAESARALAGTMGTLPVYTDLARKNNLQLKAQMSDINQLEQWESVTYTNTVMLKTSSSHVNGVFIKGRILMTVNHFVNSVRRGGGYFKVVTPNNAEGSSFNITQCDVMQLTDANDQPDDLAFITLPSAPSRRDITSKFCSANSLQHLSQGTYVLSGLRDVKGTMSVVTFHGKNLTELPSVSYESKHGPITISHSVEYDVDTKAGDCGALVYVKNAFFAGKIVGLHVAGHAGIGVARVVSREFLERNLARFEQGLPTRMAVDARLPFSAEMGYVPTLKAEVPEETMTKVGNCLSLGTLEPVFAPSRTQIRPSAVSGTLCEPTTKPAFLRKVTLPSGETVDPLTKGVGKVLSVHDPINTELLNMCVEDVASLHLPQPNTYKGVLTIEEAIQGIEGDETLGPINRTSSAGYPWNKNTTSPGKREWLGYDSYDISDEVRQACSELISRCRKNQRGDVVWLATLKDERRPIEKVDQGKTRVFTAGPMHYTIVFRQYFLAFISHMMKNRITNEVGVGTNVYSIDWHRTGRQLSKYGKNVIAGDFSNFDGSLRSDILWKILHLINDWYDDGEENALIRTVLFEEICSARVLVRSELIQWDHSQPSGNPATVIINSLFNQIVMRYAYLLCQLEHQLPLSMDFRHNVSLQTFGDDNVLNIHDNVIEWYNQLTITAALAKIGLTYTDEGKTGELVPYRTLEDIRYLKRAFVPDESGIFRAPLEISVVEEMTNWVRGLKGNALPETYENCKFALRESFWHGRPTFEKHRAVLTHALRNVGVNTPLPYYAELESQYGVEFEHSCLFAQEGDSNQHATRICPKIAVQDLLVGDKSSETTVTGTSVFTEVRPKTNLGLGKTLKRAAREKPSFNNTQLQQDTNTDVPTTSVEISTNVEAPAPSTPMPSTVKSTSNSNSTVYTLLNLLARFVVIETLTWTSDAAVLPLWLSVDSYLGHTQNYLRAYELPEALFEASNLLRQKVNNHLYMRSDIEFEVKVNTNPFQQGELLMAYFPKSLNTSRFRAEGNDFMAAVTSAPHRILKLQHADTAVLRIPYANIVEHLDISNPDHSFGRFVIYVSAPLRGPASVEKADITIRARFVDPQLYVPTDNSIMTNEKYRRAEIQALESISKSQRNLPRGLTAQMGEGEVQGPITRLSQGVGAVADVLSGVPVVGKVASVAGWIARCVGGVAQVFGWSKPTDLVLPSMVSPKHAAYMGNTEGKDCSHVLAQIPDNSIDSSSMVPSNKDELALGSIFERPNTVGRFTVPKNLFSGRALLFSWEVSPFNYLVQQPSSNGQDFALGSFSFASLLGRLWRGSIQYSLRTVQTQYHAGRAVAVYFPNRTRSDIPATLNEELTSNSHVIIDLNAKCEGAESLETPIVIPYTSNEPWKRTLWKNSSGLYDATTLNTCVGVVGVYSYNELVCPDTVAQEVTFLLSVSAGPDYELAQPQIQIQGGFADVYAPNLTPELVQLLNTTYVGDMLVSAVGLGEYPSLSQSSEVVIDQSGGEAKWVAAEGATVELPDGRYTVTLNADWTSNENIFTDGPLEFTLVVLDRTLSALTTPLMATNVATVGVETISVVMAAPSRVLFAQEGDTGGSEPIPDDQLVAAVLPVSDARIATTGEYFESLRPLLKRFVKTARLDLSNPVELHPFAYSSYDSTEVGPLAIGQRTWTTGTSGNTLKESWVSLISYLFRFCSGSARTKLFLTFNDEVQTSLSFSDDLFVNFNTEQNDPVFVTSGVVNNAVETELPYYSQLKARVVGDQLHGSGPKIRYQSSQARTFDFFEAAGDDYNFWFMVGPPIMRPVDVKPVDLTTIASGAVTRSARDVRHCIFKNNGQAPLRGSQQPGSLQDVLHKSTLLSAPMVDTRIRSSRPSHVETSIEHPIGVTRASFEPKHEEGLPSLKIDPKILERLSRNKMSQTPPIANGF